MATVMKLCGDAHGRALAKDGWYLEDFDFEAHDGLGLITMTPRISEAKRFEDFGAAIAFWRTSPVCKPLREDGKPNRPLTSTNWTFLDPDKHNQGADL